MKNGLTLIFAYMPFLFGVGFVAPLIAQVFAELQGEPWMSADALGIGLMSGGIWGAYANWRGSWL